VSEAKQRTGRWGDFWVRVGSASVLAPLGVAAIWLGGIWWDLVLVAIVAGLGAEWARMSDRDGGAGHGGEVSMPAAFAVAGAASHSGVAGLFALFTAALVVCLITRRASDGAGIVYIGLGAIALIYLRQGPPGLADVLLVVFVVWGCDIGAYLTGRLIGGRKLAPFLSPGKTWSGAAGGLVCGTLSGVAVAAGFQAQPAGLAAAAAVSAVLSVAAEAGDLLESAIKRHFGKKDSGNLIPGHGGLFDRLDGLIAAAPVACLLSLGAVPGQTLWTWRVH
jgi:phosphatidate cytidylyltransferase